MNIYAKPETDWPLELPGAVFLPRAVGRIGAALHPGEWTGFEGLARLTHLPAKDQVGAIRALVQSIDSRAVAAAVKLDASLSVLKQQSVPPSISWRVTPTRRVWSAEEIAKRSVDARLKLATTNDQLFACATEEAIRRNAEAQPRMARFDAVCRALVERCNSSLETYYRAPDGEMVPLPASWWNLTPAEWPSRFTTGQVNRLAPMQNDSMNGRRDRCWLYVDADGLEAWLRLIQTPSVEGWRPAPEEKFTAWVCRAGVDAGLRALLAQRGNQHPTIPDVRVIAQAVWNEDRPDQPRQLRSFERYFA